MAGNFVRSVRVLTAFALGVGTPTILGAQSVAVEAPRSTTARTVTVSLHGVSLQHALERIAQQADLKPFFSDAVTRYSAPMTVQLKQVPVDDAFARALRGTGLRAVITSGKVIIERDLAVVAVVEGSVSGIVTDAATKRPLRGVRVTLEGRAASVMTEDDGRFRFVNVEPGSYVVSVRLLGYARATRAVRVSAGETAVVEIALAPSANALDQVIVTGTVIATAQREISNAMTVITAKDLEQRGITKIDQLFRGDVPGVFAMNQGSNSVLDQVTMFSRGATALANTSAGTEFSTNPMKTYVDGVELADPQYLSQIDPKSIERIEIVTGPQASTIYGSNAINGVMQVFTKRGTTARPQLTATLLSGWVENNFRPSRTPQHDHAAQVTGVEGHWAYNAGGSWTYMGPWTPGKQTSRLSGFGGARLQRGPVTADGSLRLATTRTRQGGSVSQADDEFRARGWYPPRAAIGVANPITQTLVGQTLGLSLGVTPVSWWSHELVLGADRSAPESQGIAPIFTAPSDTLVFLNQSIVDRRSVRYASTVQVPLTRVARAMVAVGADAWQSVRSSLNVRALALTGTLTPSGTPTVTRRPGHNAGGFLQAQVGLWEQLFVTYGLRAEWNPTYGEEAQPNWAPRMGMAYTQDIETPFGAVTAKLRASYGRSTRPPAAGAAATGKVSEQSLSASTKNILITPYGDYDYVVANPELVPEHQQGGEGGLELYFGRRGLLVVTRYNQTVEGLIAQPRVDSVRSLAPQTQPPLLRTSCDAEGYCYYEQYQNLNVGNIRNQGWELQGTMVTGPLTTRGTYSWTKSRTIGVDSRYRTFFNPINYPQYQPGASFAHVPEHTWSGSVTYARARSMVALNLSGTGMLKSIYNEQYLTSITSFVRLTENRVRMNELRYAMLNAGYVLADLNASQRFSSRVEGVVQVQNLGDVYRNDLAALYASLGRQTKLGLRLRL